MFIEFILRNKMLIIVAVLSAIVASQAAYAVLLRSQKATIVAEKARMKTLLDQSQANLLQLQNDIKTQNDAITRLKTDADTRLAKGAVEVKKAQQLAGTYKQRADDLMNTKAPQDVPRCDAANSLINKEISNARK